MRTTVSECPFCRVVSGEAPAEIIHASDNVIAFRDSHPKAPTHILLIPKDHLESAADLSEKDGGMLGELFAVAAHVAKAEEIDESGWRLVTNVGPEAGQSVFHLHFHLLGGRALGWPPG